MSLNFGSDISNPFTVSDNNTIKHIVTSLQTLNPEIDQSIL